jgi:O-antigen/teichoic acid export membrane protein
MSVLKKLAGETAIYGLSSIVGRLFNYVLVPFHTRIFMTGEYGVQSYFYAWSGLLMVFFSYRMETAFFRFGTDETERDKAFSTGMMSIIGSTMILVALMMCFSNPIAAFISYPDYGKYIRYLALIVGLDVLAELPFAKLRLERKPIRFASIKLTNIGVNMFFNFFFLLICPWILASPSLSGLHGFIGSFYVKEFGVGYIFVSNLLASLVTLLLLIPSFRVDWTFDKALWHKMIGYSAPLIIVGLAGIINEVADRYLLKQYLPYTSTKNDMLIGIYSGCYKLSILISLFTQAFRYAAEPFFFAQAKDKNAPVLFAKVSRYFSLMGAFAFAGIMLYMPLIQTLVGPNYRSGLGIVPILLLANICLGLYYNFSIWSRLKDKTLIASYIAIAGALVTIILNIILIPRLDYMGSAWATLGCYVFMMVATYLMGKRYFPVPYAIPRMMLYLLAALGVYFLSDFLFRCFQPKLIVQLLLNTFCFGLFLFSMYLLEKKDILKLLKKE